MKLPDYHIHSKYSPDSRADLSKIVQVAIQRNLSEIVITDHFEPNDGENMAVFVGVDERMAEIKTLQAKYEGQILIREGVEFGQPHLYPEETHQMIASRGFHYVIGSAHRVVDDLDVGALKYRYDNLDAICHEYLDGTLQMAIDNRFDCVGHIDLVKRYAFRQGVSMSILPYKDLLEAIFKTLISNGKGIEINTSGLREPLNSLMPNGDIVKFYRELGGEIITIGSDAHDPKDVGKGLEEAVEMLKYVGFNYIAVYEERKPKFIRL